MSAKTALPTRLIYIREESPHLIESAILTNHPRYATQSHSWGSLQLVTLSQGNLEAFKSRITPEASPRTFHEAIIFAPRLGIDYLWIDSLCIIQDSDLDWKREFGK